MSAFVELAVRAVLEFISSALPFAPDALERERPWWVKSAGVVLISAGLAVVVFLIWAAWA
jgi:hypothetical protein